MNIAYNSPRTIAQLHKELVEADPHCGLTMTALRRGVRSGLIRSTRVGSKYLITHKSVAEYISGSECKPFSEDAPVIRQVER